MAFEDFKNRYMQSEQEVEGIVKQALDQLLQKTINLSKELSEQPDLKTAAVSLNYPSVALTFQTGGLSNHLVLMPPDFVTQFYAWMIADEPAEAVGDEQLEGIKEAFDQVFGQIKLSIADDQAKFAIEDIQVESIEDASSLDPVLSAEPAMYGEYKLEAEEKSFTLNYYAWPVPGAEFDTQPTGNDMPEPETVTEVEKVTVQPAEFSNLSGSGTDSGSPRNVDMLMDVDLEVTVELDRKTVLVSELLKLGKGSIIELEKSAGEPLDIFVNGRKFAEGEVVVIDDKFGIRLTQLLSPKDRLKSLGT